LFAAKVAHGYSRAASASGTASASASGA
jgi:hypothetical protein